jgi:hypothetical protein
MWLHFRGEYRMLVDMWPGVAKEAAHTQSETLLTVSRGLAPRVRSCLVDVAHACSFSTPFP